MLDETVAAVLEAPAWAQVVMAFFALMLVVMVAGPPVTHRRVAVRFAALAAALGAARRPGADKFAESFDLEREGRRFTVRRELRSSAGGSSYRGPRGHLVICETRLAGSRWEPHGVDITERGALSFLGGPTFETGDEAFDRRFTVRQDGVPVRDGWLDAATRNAVSAFFDAAPLVRSLWVQGGILQYLAVAPKGIDATALTDVVRAQAAVAQAFEHSAGWRGPTA